MDVDIHEAQRMNIYEFFLTFPLTTQGDILGCHYICVRCPCPAQDALKWRDDPLTFHHQVKMCTVIWFPAEYDDFVFCCLVLKNPRTS